MRTTSEIVRYLTRYYKENNGEIKENLLPENIEGLVSQMAEFLEERLKEETPHKAIWDDFSSAPEDNATSLAGVLEPLFEAQPSVRERVDGFMNGITANEVQLSNQVPPEHPEESLKAQPGGLVPDKGENSSVMADTRQEKNPPAYLYNNERAGFESDREAPVSNPFMVGKNAQVIYTPNEKLQFPFMFTHLDRLSETSEDLNSQEKQILQKNLQKIRYQLTGKQPFNEAGMGTAFETIWETAPSYANALIESLQSHIDELPVETQDFIIQLHTPLH